MKKKGATWLEYILAMAVFVSLAVTITIYAKHRTESLSESTTQYIEAKEQCKQVFIDADCSASQVNIENKGMLNIDKLIVRKFKKNGEVYVFDSDLESDQVQVQKSISLNINPDIKRIELLPIINVESKQAACNTKKLVVDC